MVKIGNSQGVRIPKLLLEQSGLSGEVELEVTEGQITPGAVKQVRVRLGQSISGKGNAW